MRYWGYANRSARPVHLRVGYWRGRKEEVERFDVAPGEVAMFAASPLQPMSIWVSCASGKGYAKVTEGGVYEFCEEISEEKAESNAAVNSGSYP